MKFSKGLIVCSISLFYITANSQSVVDLREPMGAYAPGFRVIHTYDYTRDFKGKHVATRHPEGKEHYRPMQVGIWYPAEQTATPTRMTYRDYYLLKAHETGWLADSDSLWQMVLDDSDPIEEDQMDREMKAPVMAIPDAQPAAGKFPVVIYGPSWWSTTFENEVLFEFLASHGFVVLSSPSMGPQTREMPINAQGIEAQARDMEFLIGEAVWLEQADESRLAVAGFSLGGLSNVLVASRNPSVKAWIGLDPSIHEAYDLFRDSPYYDYAKFHMPSLFINSQGYMHSLPFYDKLVYSDSYVVDLPYMNHTDLASQFVKLNLTHSSQSVSELETRIKGYNQVCRYTLAFLQGVFQERLSYEVMVEDKLRPTTDETAGGLLFTSKESLPEPGELAGRLDADPDEDILAFIAGLKRDRDPFPYPEGEYRKLVFQVLKRDRPQGMALLTEYEDFYPGSAMDNLQTYLGEDQLAQMFKTIFEFNGDCSFTYEQINHSGHRLFMSERPEEGLVYLELNHRLYPDNFQASFNLGLGYFRMSRLKEAETYFTKCLEQQPDARYEGLARDFLEKCKA